MNKSAWIEHKGKIIRFTDFSGLKGLDFLEAIRDSEAEDLKTFAEAGTKNNLVLLDYTNTVISSDVAQALRASGNKTRDLVSKVAVLGITGIKKTLLNLANQVTGNKMTAFDTKEQALDWLAS